jgi:3-hydroxyacyl-[acyl-carrier-protein] dehydratase
MSKITLSIKEIREILPHRYPMLLVDRVLEITPDEVIAEKLVSANEPFFVGHFPEIPIMPGVLMIEALAQAAGIGVRYNDPEARSRDLVLAGVNRCRFRRPVVPGDVLTLHTRNLRRRGNLVVVEGIARVGTEVAAEAEIMAAFVKWGENQP